MIANQYPVTTTPVEIIAVGSHDTGRDLDVVIQNVGSVTAWLAETTVKATSSAGFPVLAGQTVRITLPGYEIPALYAATASSTTSVAVLTA